MTERTRSDRGYAIVVLALILVPLLAAAAVAVDLGARYSRAAEVQRAADAAALAGVAMLPRGLGAAETEARQVAARNGFVHGQDGVSVTVTQVDDERISVTITDDDVEGYFVAQFSANASISRVATARFVRAVNLGSARNFLGTGDIMGTSFPANRMEQVSVGVNQTPLNRAQTSTLRENFWLAISGQCSSRENGDRFNTISQANYSNASNPRPLGVGAGSFACQVGGTVQPNLEFRNSGYVYSVTVPSAYDYGPLMIEVFDPRSCTGNGSRSGDQGGNQAATATFTVRSGSTDPLGGDIVDGPHVFAPGTNSCGIWLPLHTSNAPAGKTFFVQVQAGVNTNSGTSTNAFSLRATVNTRSTNRWWACSSDPIETSLYDPKCPQVSAVQDMGVLASLSTVDSGQPAEFFLAEIGDEYSGKRMDVTLFDPGEGAERLRIKDPTGGYASFTWKVDCTGGVVPPTGGCESNIPTTALDLVGSTFNQGQQGCTSSQLEYDSNHNGTADRCVNNPQPGGHRASRWKYNDRPLTLSVQLPADIDSAYGGATWWKIEYTTNTAPTDRTTWSVSVNGDPVRLVPNP